MYKNNFRTKCYHQLRMYLFVCEWRITQYPGTLNEMNLTWKLRITLVAICFVFYLRLIIIAMDVLHPFI